MAQLSVPPSLSILPGSSVCIEQTSQKIILDTILPLVVYQRAFCELVLPRSKCVVGIYEKLKLRRVE